MKRAFIAILGCIGSCVSFAQSIDGEYVSEWQWGMNGKTNFVNQLRLNLSVPIKKINGTIEASTLHVAKTSENVIGDWQDFSNLDADNMVAAIAVLGYMQTFKAGHVFLGVRNVNEDFFISPVTSFFVNSSCGIFPTIAASYPIANYPNSGLTVYFDVSKGNWTFRNSIYNGMGYNGWKGHDNPFIVRPRRDGIFNISQLDYSSNNGHYFAGVAVHTRQFPIDDDGNMVPPEEDIHKTTCAWWVYGEQEVWKGADKNISCMVQYSENTSHKNSCYRYGEIGGAYSDAKNECGISGQYARFQQGTEYSLEVTWKRQLTNSIAVQPTFQYIKNNDGKFTVACARLYYSF